MNGLFVLAFTNLNFNLLNLVGLNLNSKKSFVLFALPVATNWNVSPFEAYHNGKDAEYSEVYKMPNSNIDNISEMVEHTIILN